MRAREWGSVVPPPPQDAHLCAALVANRRGGRVAAVADDVQVAAWAAGDEDEGNRGLKGGMKGGRAGGDAHARGARRVKQREQGERAGGHREAPAERKNQ